MGSTAALVPCGDISACHRGIWPGWVRKKTSEMDDTQNTVKGDIFSLIPFKYTTLGLTPNNRR